MNEKIKELIQEIEKQKSFNLEEMKKASLTEMSAFFHGR